MKHLKLFESNNPKYNELSKDIGEYTKAKTKYNKILTTMLPFSKYLYQDLIDNYDDYDEYGLDELDEESMDHLELHDVVINNGIEFVYFDRSAGNKKLYYIELTRKEFAEYYKNFKIRIEANKFNL
jgi:hypothetical protein